MSDLADVIDVYYFDPAKPIADRNALAAETALGTLTDALAGMPASTSGVLLPAGTAAEDNPENLPVGEVVVTVALKMQESAGNEYPNKSIGSQFAVQLLATQMTFEEDSFGDQYDGESKVAMEISGETPVDSIVAALNGTDGMLLIGDGAETTSLYAYNVPEGNIETEEDFLMMFAKPIEADNLTIADMSVVAPFDYQIIGDGTKLDNVVVQQERSNYNTNGLTISGSDTTVTNAQFTGGRQFALYFATEDDADSVTTIDGCEFGSDETTGSGIYFKRLNGTMNISNTKINSTPSDSALSIGRGQGAVYSGTVNITDSTIVVNKIRLSYLSQISIKNVTFSRPGNSPVVMGLTATQPIVFEDCTFHNQLKITATYNQQIVFKNCKYGDTLLTSENYRNCITYVSPASVSLQFTND